MPMGLGAGHPSDANFLFLAAMFLFAEREIRRAARYGAPKR
jgi:hypothetical protein